MSWNYRVIKREISGESIFAIHSVHYDDVGKAIMISVNPQWPQGETRNELLLDIGSYMLALEKNVIDYEYFEFRDKE